MKLNLQLVLLLVFDLTEDGRSYGKPIENNYDPSTKMMYYSDKNPPIAIAQDRYIPRNTKKGSTSSNGNKSPSPNSMAVSSYEADSSPKGKYKPYYNQAEPPPYPPLSSLSSDSSNKMNSFDANSQTSSFYDYSYGYSKPEGSSDTQSDTPSDSYVAKKPTKPKAEDMSYMPSKTPSETNEDFMSLASHTKPSEEGDSDDNYLPYNPDHFQSYSPEHEDSYFPHEAPEPNDDDTEDAPGSDKDAIFPSYYNSHSSENSDDPHDHYSQHKPSKPHKSSSDNSNEEIYFHYPIYKPFDDDDKSNSDKTPSGKKKKPTDSTMHGPPEPDSSDGGGDDDDDDPHHPETPKIKYKHPPPPSPPAPEIYFSKPPKDVKDMYQPMHDYDSYLEDEHKEHPDHDSDYRVSKKPYSYYYLGRKLWYVPLWFSVYFIIYVTALILKSIARHKINYPIYHWKGRSLSGNAHTGNAHNSLNEMSKNVNEAISRGKRHFM